MNETEKEILLNLLLEKMQEIAEIRNNDIRQNLEFYKNQLYTIYKGLINA